MFRRVEAYPESVPLLEGRSVALAAAGVVSTAIWNCSDRALRSSLFFLGAGTPWARLPHLLTGLYIVDVATFSALAVTIEVFGYWHVTPSVLGAARLLSTTAVGAGVVGQLSAFRVVAPYGEVRITNAGAGPTDVDYSVQLRTR